jgi:hypothetical protein
MPDVRTLISQARDLASISPAEFARALEVDLGELERNARVEPGTARWFPQSAAIQGYMRASLLVIDAMLGVIENSTSAVFYFKHMPCEEFEYKTPQMVVSEGRVVDMLLRL